MGFGHLFPPVTRGVGRFGTLVLPFAWVGNGRFFGDPVVSVRLRRHYMLLGVITGWPRLRFSWLGWVFGVSLSGLPLLGFPFGVAI